MKITQKIAVLALAVTMAFTLTACHITTPATVINVDGTDISSGLYLLYQLQANSSATALLEDSSQNVLKATIEEKNGEDWIHDETLRLARRYVWIESEFEAQGLELTAEEQASATAQAESNYSNNSDYYAKNGIGQQTYTTYYLNESKYEKLGTEYASANSDSISDESAMQYMNSKYSNVSILMLPGTDASSVALSEEATAQLQELVDDLVSQLSGGATLDEIGEDALKNAMEICGREYTEDAISQYLSTMFISEGSGYYFDSDTTSEIMAADIGFAGQTSFGLSFMVYQKVDSYADVEDFQATYRDTIVSAMCWEEFDENIKSASEGYAVSEDSSAVKRYSAKNIKEA